MYSNFKKRFVPLALGVLSTFYSFGQGDETFRTKQFDVYVQLRPALMVPNTFGTNFFNDAYDTSAGFMGEALVFFKSQVHLGIQGGFSQAEVTDSALVGDFESTTSSHHYILGGYSFLSRTNNLGLEASLGLGYARYANRKENIRFYDDGFSLMMNTRLSYRFSSIVGVHTGAQLTKDFLNTQVAPELRSFFKNANIVYLSVGLVFYLNQ
jgi:hypothetical protein